MKKILLSIFGIIILGIINFSVAEDIYFDGNTTFSLSSDSLGIVNWASCSNNCSIEILDNNSNQIYYNEYYYDMMDFINDFFLLTGGITYSIDTTLSEGAIKTYSLESSGESCDYSGYILESNVTENYCTNKFSSLIPESEITTGYCETHFGMIDPENCPASGGTGDINWSTFRVNNYQVQGASNIFLYLPDFLDWDYTYLDSGSTLQVDVENQGDEQYISDILTVQQYHPSSEDFTQSFVGGLTLLLPYIIIVLFIVFIWKIIKKIFR